MIETDGNSFIYNSAARCKKALSHAAKEAWARYISQTVSVGRLNISQRNQLKSLGTIEAHTVHAFGSYHRCHSDFPVCYFKCPRSCDFECNAHARIYHILRNLPGPICILHFRLELMHLGFLSLFLSQSWDYHPSKVILELVDLTKKIPNSLHLVYETLSH